MSVFLERRTFSAKSCGWEIAILVYAIKEIGSMCKEKRKKYILFLHITFIHKTQFWSMKLGGSLFEIICVNMLMLTIEKKLGEI